MDDDKFVEVSFDGEAPKVVRLERRPTRKIGLVYDFRKTPRARIIDAETGVEIHGVKSFSLKKGEPFGQDELTVIFNVATQKDASPHVIR